MPGITAFDRPCAPPWANQQPPSPDEEPRQRKVKDEVAAIFQRPSTGRTSRLGRKVEKPGDISTAGPSGQHELTKHDRKHTNK